MNMSKTASANFVLNVFHKEINMRPGHAPLVLTTTGVNE